MQDQVYASTAAISQTAIKDWLSMSPSKWHKIWILKTLSRPRVGAAAQFGSLVDCLILSPENYDKQYIVSDIAMPSESIQTVVAGVLANLKELNANAEKLNAKEGKIVAPIKELKLDYEDIIIAESVKAEYFANQPARAYREVVTKGQELFQFLVKAERKSFISPSDKTLADELVTILKNDPVSKGFFLPKKDCEVIFQQQIFAELELSGFENINFMPLKGMLDNIHLNHKKKVAREVDLKVPEDAYLFKDSVKRFDYPMQHSFYNYLLGEWLKVYKKGKYKDYQIMPPLNVVIDPVEKVPYIYAYNFTDLEIKRYGHEGMPWIRGWEQVINEIAWHIDTQQWDRPREHYLNGMMMVNYFNK